MRPRRKTFTYPAPEASAEVVRDSATLDAPTLEINVRAAKDQLSSLLDEAARGREVIITSDGQPKARLVAFRPRRRAFRVDWALLSELPAAAGTPTAEALIRADRDGRW